MPASRGTDFLVHGYKPKGIIYSALSICAFVSVSVCHRLSLGPFDEIACNLVCGCFLANQNSHQSQICELGLFGLFQSSHLKWPPP